jgi:chemotaxis protein MotA
MSGSNQKWSLDVASLLGLVVGVGGIIGGLILEGGRVDDVVQTTGAIIVLCGTLGAVLLTTPPAVVLRAFKLLRWVLFEPRYAMDSIIVEMLAYSNQARRDGLVSLDTILDRASDPFIRKALTLAVDGTDCDALRDSMELELTLESQRIKGAAKVYESAGGYAPTIGIIGAVLGLIQVMKHLQEIDKVGHGIAVAFVATVYGVGLANLLLLPAAAKIRNRAEELLNVREMMLEGVCQIVQGSHPKMIEQRLAIYASKPETSASVRRPVPMQGKAA